MTDNSSGVTAKRWDLFEAVPDALILMRGDGTIAFANRQAERLFGYKRQELVGLCVEGLLPERFRQRHAEMRAAYFAEPVVRPMGSGLELLAVSSDGREFPVDISLSPVPSSNGMLAAASIRSIAHRKKVELQLQNSLAEVESLRSQLSAENLYLREEIERTHSEREFIGESDLVKLTLQKIDQVAVTDANVLIVGETGTGKELAARAIHARSHRKDRPLIKVNCAALPTGLIESELFGHEKGAFTGALELKVGRFELADEGTIFLDEIGELHPDLQSKLLHVLQEGQFERIGSTTTKTVNVRVIAATNRDLRKAMQEGLFRSDLFFRLAVFPLELPPLRARREDVPLLVWHFVSKKAGRLGRKIERIPQPTMDKLVAYPWPGNVRELENVIERAMIVSPDSTLVVEELLGHLEERGDPERTLASIKDIERIQILRVLDQCNWRIKGKNNAAERLGLNPATLRYRMKKLGIERR
jgi:PAS domain S-box-containing protein